MTLYHVIAQAALKVNTEPGAYAPSMGLYAFVVGLVVIVGGLGFFLRGMFSQLAASAAQHASTYALAYAKGSALIAIAMFASFQETWGMVTASDVRLWQWWDYFIALTKPIAAGLAVLVAFLDRSLSPPPDKPNG
jgi:hypothetical protein